MNRPAASPAAGSSVLRRSVIVAAYAFVFFGILPVLLARLGLRLDEAFAWASLGPRWQGIGLGLAVVGGAGTTWTMVYMGRKGRGWPISHLPPAHFVGAGPYRLSRHPIYVAYTITFMGVGLLKGSIGWSFAATGLLVTDWLTYALAFEEPRLERRFGIAYRTYRDQVPALPVPGRRRARRLAKGVWRVVRPAADRMANHVILFHAGKTVWVTYGLFLGIGAAVGTWLMAAILLGGGMPAGRVTVYLVLLVLAMVLGGRVLWLIYEAPSVLSYPIRTMRTVGFVSWGALVAGILFALVAGPAFSSDPLWLMDSTLAGLVACAVFGRLGCFTYGCCFGRESSCGVEWTHPDAKMNRQFPSRRGRRRVPTQLMEAGWLFAVLMAAWLTMRSAAPGVAAGLVLILYAQGRFITDCFRDERRFGPWELTAGQIGALAAASLGVAVLYAAHGIPDPAALDVSLVPGALQVWPAIAAAGILVFLVAGFHWRQVGRW